MGLPAWCLALSFSKGSNGGGENDVVCGGAGNNHRLHLIRFHGVLAPNAKLRPEIVPSAPVNANAHSADHGETPHPSALARMSWARLLKRVFDIDIEQCPQCGGTLKIIAAIEDPAVITKILTHLGWSARAPPRSPARHFALIQTA